MNDGEVNPDDAETRDAMHAMLLMIPFIRLLEDTLCGLLRLERERGREGRLIVTKGTTKIIIHVKIVYTYQRQCIA
jgi:hypothetical protein